MKQFLLLVLFVLGGTAHAASDFFAPPATSSFGNDTPQFLPVEEAYQSILQWHDDRMTLTWNAAEAYYLYKERFALKASVNGKPQPISTQFETGKLKQDPFFGETEVYYHGTTITLSDLPDIPFTLSVTSQGCADAGLCYPPQTQHYRIDPLQHTVNEISATDFLSSNKPVINANDDHQALWLVLIFAALGGAILNLMPCVFPVLGLKVLSFTNAHNGSPLKHGLVYSVGVVASFIAVAGLLISLQQAGQAIGWGFQLQTPWFVTLLACLFFVLSLNLLGLFEIGGSWTDIGGGLSRKKGYTGSFFTGVLATVVASPCTAPFMGTAVGFAASQSPPVALLVFGFIGLGMALPVLLLTLFPAGLQRLPKSGSWMISLRQFLAFPLLATAIWLAWVIGRQTGANGMALTLLAWLFIGFGLWLHSKGNKVSAWLIVALTFVLAIVKINQLPLGGETPSGHFDRSEIQTLRASGKNVFLDVTADWCITCAANEALVLNTSAIRDAFTQHNVQYVIADWTNYDPAITQLLTDYKRNGIPLYIYYPADLNAPEIMLPQILSKDVVIEILNR
ncbi:Thiol:disulfide interchange protein DsbD [Zhongshania aliphaticivorans]|uniref:Thiol:disulfide interchange protein DsbD n=1 Tax=Zhongshania aliphaticivorans TaxID=1470434 RepID=A0A5S9N5U7_9GAMM|nr:protein-disulfide reductase DsbD [Zhongshania aliphaticivorans]CAA0082099.1 Thiol:disulfide interchange protein DsbD [Zhongshania aliphaticivorans]CAA0084468.1 Thiol:disulfide interchange protein DsbD [Zhongshania aliphaticivorans]